MSGTPGVRLAAGTRLERYEIVRFMANGGFGDVYEARDTRLGRRVVVKSLRAEAAADPDIRARFLREGRLAAAIEHPHVVRVFDVLEEPSGDAYVVMEFLDGRDLGDHLAAHGPLPVEWLCDVMLPVCAAVAQVHARGILHRDLKPGNLFLSASADGELIPKLLDFGISRPLDDQTGDVRTRTGTVLGSPRYMSPEQFDGKRKPDGRADVYALGAVLYRCLTGALPYQQPGDEGHVELFTIISRIAARELVAPRAWRASLPVELEAVILRAMAYEREHRFIDARELGLALAPFASMGARARWEPVLRRSERASLEGPVAPTASVPPSGGWGVPPLGPDVTTTSASVSALAVKRDVLPRRSFVPWVAVALTIILLATVAGLAVRSARAVPVAVGNAGATLSVPASTAPESVVRQPTAPPQAPIPNPTAMPGPVAQLLAPVAQVPTAPSPSATRAAVAHPADELNDHPRRHGGRRRGGPRGAASASAAAAPSRGGDNVTVPTTARIRPEPTQQRCANGADCGL